MARVRDLEREGRTAYLFFPVEEKINIQKLRPTSDRGGGGGEGDILSETSSL